MTYVDEVLADSPLLYWRYGDSSGTTVADSSGNSRNGTYVGTPTLGVAGAVGGDTAAAFDGSADYATLTNPPALQISTGAVECFVKASTPGSGFRGMLLKQHAYGLFLIDGVLSAYDWAAATVRSSGVNIADNLWHHCVLDFNSGVATGSTLYLDGSSVATFTYTILNQTGSIFGAAGNTTTQRLNGTLDEGAIYPAMLGPTRVAAHFDAAQSAGLLLNATLPAIQETFTFRTYTPTDLSNGLDGIRIEGETIHLDNTDPVALPPAAQRTVREDVAIAYPTPTLVNGRPT